MTKRRREKSLLAQIEERQGECRAYALALREWGDSLPRRRKADKIFILAHVGYLLKVADSLGEAVAEYRDDASRLRSFVRMTFKSLEVLGLALGGVSGVITIADHVGEAPDAVRQCASNLTQGIEETEAFIIETPDATTGESEPDAGPSDRDGSNATVQPDAVPARGGVPTPTPSGDVSDSDGGGAEVSVQPGTVTIEPDAIRHATSMVSPTISTPSTDAAERQGEPQVWEESKGTINVEAVSGSIEAADRPDTADFTVTVTDDSGEPPVPPGPADVLTAEEGEVRPTEDGEDDSEDPVPSDERLSDLDQDAHLARLEEESRPEDSE